MAIANKIESIRVGNTQDPLVRLLRFLRSHTADALLIGQLTVSSIFDYALAS